MTEEQRNKILKELEKDTAKHSDGKNRPATIKKLKKGGYLTEGGKLSRKYGG